MPRGSDRRDAQSESLGVGLHDALELPIDLDPPPNVRSERVLVGDAVGVDRREQEDGDHEDEDSEGEHRRLVMTQLTQGRSPGALRAPGDRHADRWKQSFLGENRFVYCTHNSSTNMLNSSEKW